LQGADNIEAEAAGSAASIVKGAAGVVRIATLATASYSFGAIRQ